MVPGYGHAVLRKTDPRYEVISLDRILKWSMFSIAISLPSPSPLTGTTSIRIETLARRQTVQIGGTSVRDCAACVDRARQNQEPVAKRRRAQWLLAGALRFEGAELLHRHVRCVACLGCVGARGLVARSRLPDRAPQVDDHWRHRQIFVEINCSLK